MLFQNLHQLTSKGVAITIKVADAGSGKLEVNVFPDSGKSGAQLLAKCFVATPTELDDEFPGVIQQYCSLNGSLKDQLEDLQLQAEAALAQAKEKSAGTKAKTGKQPASQTEAGSQSEADALDSGTQGSEGDSQAAPFSL